MASSRSRVALATYAALPALNDDDCLLLDALCAEGACAEPAVWDDASVDWSGFDAVVVRSVWDYHRRYDAFRAWLDTVERSGARLVNPARLLRWNSDKRYLRELERLGVRTVPTHWGAGDGGRESLRTILARAGWREAVVKPVVSASGHDTWRTSIDAADRDQPPYAALSAVPGGALVQPFVEEVRTDGEWSLVFIGGEFSHAAIKRPAGDEFRVQWEHGGTADPADPPRQLVLDAADVLRAAARACALAVGEVAYARVDGVRRDDRLLLMELECLEPHLFLSYSATAASRLARAVLAAAAG